MPVSIKKDLLGGVCMAAAISSLGAFGTSKNGKCSRNNTSYVKKASVKRKKKKRTSNKSKAKNRR